jgi:hypothetical protein
MIVRVVKRSYFTTISNVPLNDSRLSWEARGLLAWLLSKPNTWTVNREAIARHGRTGRDKVTRMLTELTANGYLVRTRHRNDDGQFRWESIVYEVPIDRPNVGEPSEASPEDSAVENPRTAEPKLENPSAVEPSLAQTLVIKTESLSTDSGRTEDQTRKREGAPLESLNLLSEELCLDDELRQFARACGCDADDEFRAFRNYYESKKRKHRDYRAAFMSWMEKTARFGVTVHVQRNDQTAAESLRENCSLKKSACEHLCHHAGCLRLPNNQCHHLPSVEQRDISREVKTGWRQLACLPRAR